MKRNNNTSNTLLAVIIAAVFLTISVAVALVSVNSEKNHNKETVDKTAENENAPIPKDGINGNEGLLVQPKPEPEPETEPEPQIDTVSFVAVGDNIIHDAVLADAKRNSPDYDFRPMFENVEDIISSADFAYINQESPFAGEERGYSGYPSFNSPDKVGFDLAEIGFDIVNLANNHMMDKGVSGYRRTVEFWKSQPDVTYIGGYESKADFDNIRIIEKNGIKVALLSYTYGINSPFDGSDMYVPFADDREIDRQTREAKTLADAVIVSVHWGKEHWNDNLEPSQVQNRQMQIMVDNGVDVIIGTHPHTLEKMLWQENADGHKTLVMYSLGNILSNMEYMRNQVGGIAGFEIVKQEDVVCIQNAYFIPTVCHFEGGKGGYRVLRLSEYTDEMLEKHARQTSGPDSKRSMEYLKQIVYKTISPEFLTEDFYKENSEVADNAF